MAVGERDALNVTIVGIAGCFACVYSVLYHLTFTAPLFSCQSFTVGLADLQPTEHAWPGALLKIYTSTYCSNIFGHLFSSQVPVILLSIIIRAPRSPSHRPGTHCARRCTNSEQKDTHFWWDPGKEQELNRFSKSKVLALDNIFKSETGQDLWEVRA